MTNWYLYRLNLAKKLFTLLSLISVSTRFNLSYLSKFWSPPIFTWSIISLVANIEKLVTLSSFTFIDFSVFNFKFKAIFGHYHTG